MNGQPEWLANMDIDSQQLVRPWTLNGGSRGKMQVKLIWGWLVFEDTSVAVCRRTRLNLGELKLGAKVHNIELNDSTGSKNTNRTFMDTVSGDLVEELGGGSENE